MATFKGIVTSVSQVQRGTSKAGRAWERVDVALTYDDSKPDWPKAIVFSVMNDNIGKFNLQPGCEYEVEVDFSVREYQGRNYMSASCWKATALQAVPAQPAQQPVYQQAPPMADPAPQSDNLPF